MDTFGPMSEPVPVSGVGDLQNLELTLTVNGEVRQSGNTANMIFPVARLISYVTRFMTMEPGDILITGTPEGVSEIRPGEVVRAEISGVGSVTNRVIGLWAHSSPYNRSGHWRIGNLLTIPRSDQRPLTLSLSKPPSR